MSLSISPIIHRLDFESFQLVRHVRLIPFKLFQPRTIEVSDMSNEANLTQQVIKRIVDEHYGSLRKLFKAHNWEWVGNQSMNASATLIVEGYGSIKTFEENHSDEAHKISIFEKYDDALVTSFWRWIPDEAGGWDLRGKPTRESVIEKTTDPFLLLVYVTNKASKNQKHLENKVVGFLEVTHEAADREDVDSPNLKYPHRNSYRSSLRAKRAFEFLPDSKIDILELIPNLRERELLIHDLDKGISLSEVQIDTLKSLSYREVPLFGMEASFSGASFAPSETLKSSNELDKKFGNPLQHILAPDAPNVWLTTFYGWRPSVWGCVGFTAEHQAKTFRKETTEGVLFVIYGAKNNPRTPKEMKGKVLGIYQLSHQYGISENYLSPIAIHENEQRGEKEKWKHAFKCVRAWEIVSDQRPDIEDFAPETYALGGHQHLGSQGRRLTRNEATRLLEYDWEEVTVYGGNEIIESFPAALSPSRAGPIGKRPSSSTKEPDGPREIYVLKLKGDMADFLGISEEKLDSRWVIKAGLSKSPRSRLDAHNKALPNCAFEWDILKSTKRDGDPYIPDGESAKIVEREFQKQLLKSPDADSLGGEFFLSHPDDIDNAWHFSKIKAKKFHTR
jgi:hypothetical protein